MVREARFSWDEDDPFRPFEQPDRFDDLDDLDDLDLDPVVPRQRLHSAKVASPSTDPQGRTERCQSHKMPPAVSDDHRHLAGADWFSDEAERHWEEN